MGLPETDFFGLVQPEKKIGNGMHNIFVRDLSFSILPARKLVSQEFARTEHASLKTTTNCQVCSRPCLLLQPTAQNP